MHFAESPSLSLFNEMRVMEKVGVMRECLPQSTFIQAELFDMSHLYGSVIDAGYVSSEQEGVVVHYAARLYR